MSGPQVNIESFFRLLYDWTQGSHPISSYPGFQALLAHTWLWIVVVGYALSILGFIVIVYLIVRLFELRRREEAYYSTIISPAGVAGGANPRWEHIQSLIHETKASHWREAIIEADIMLDEALGRRGYVGDGVGEKLKAVEPSDLRTLQDAWDVHKVRNQIAHEGSHFNLSEQLARRTIARYEIVLGELKVI